MAWSRDILPNKWEIGVHLVFAGDVLDGVLFCAILFPRYVLIEIWN